MKILSTWKIRWRPRGIHRRQSPKCRATYNDNCFHCPAEKSHNCDHPSSWSIRWKTRSSIGDFAVHDEYGAAVVATEAAVVVPALVDAARWIGSFRPDRPFPLHLPRRLNRRSSNSFPPKMLWKSWRFHRSTLPGWAEPEFAVRTAFGCAPPMICETIASVLYRHNLSPRNSN